jgi:hypothetical protein
MSINAFEGHHPLVTHRINYKTLLRKITEIALNKGAKTGYSATGNQGVDLPRAFVGINRFGIGHKTTRTQRHGGKTDLTSRIFMSPCLCGENLASFSQVLPSYLHLGLARQTHPLQGRCLVIEFMAEVYFHQLTRACQIVIFSIIVSVFPQPAGPT